MWLTFLSACLLSLAVVYLPGYFAGRALSFGRFESIASAPVFSCTSYIFAGIALGLLGITCHAMALVAIGLALFVLCWLVTKLAHRAQRNRSDANSDYQAKLTNNPSTWKLACLYVAVAAGVATVVYLLAIGDPAAFSRHDDSTLHLAVARGFLETGTYNALNVGAYLDQGVSGGFYPAEWHVVTAIVASLLNNDVVLATNALTFTFLVFVFPLAMCLLLKNLFPSNAHAQYAGSLFVLAFSGFPWGFLVFGQLLPNMMAYMFIPSVFVMFMQTIEASRPKELIIRALVTLFGLLGIALAQPNGTFTFGIWAVLYGITRLFFMPDSNQAIVTKGRIAAAIAIFIAACGIWAAFFLAPFMQTSVQINWAAQTGPAAAIASGLLFMFSSRVGFHPFLSVVVLLGIIFTLKNRRYLWLSIAYFAALAFYIIDLSTDGFIKHVLTGFWYTDYHRTGAVASLYAIPLATLGFSYAVSLIKKLVDRLGNADKVVQKTDRSVSRGITSTALCSGILVVVMVICQFAPYSIEYKQGKSVKSGLPKVYDVLQNYYSWDNGLTKEECDFIEEVIGEIPDGALVINVPRDGTCWAYGVEGINVFFRRSTNTGMAGADTSKLLRTKLCDVSSNKKVRKALNDLDAHYVLQLDVISSDHPTTTSLRYDEKNWTGIETIDESTPGFTLIKSRDDMRLYYIEDIQNS